MLFNPRRIHQSMARVGKHITRSIASAHSWAGRIDGYVGVAKKTLGIMSDVVGGTEMGKQVLGSAVKALGTYDDIRQRAMTGFEQIEAVRGGLRKGGVL
jgi:hypothetical protein